MNTKEILISARSVISDKKNWTKGAYARDATGESVPIWDQRAVCFCSIGAINKAFRDFYLGQASAGFQSGTLDGVAFDALDLELNGLLTIDQFNDNATHQEVLALFDKAIANSME